MSIGCFIRFLQNFRAVCRITFRLYMTFLQALETVGFQGLQKCGCREAWERSDLADRNPGGPKARSIYRPVMRRKIRYVSHPHGGGWFFC
jgi:hypothetical protein